MLGFVVGMMKLLRENNSFQYFEPLDKKSKVNDASESSIIYDQGRMKNVAIILQISGDEPLIVRILMHSVI